MGRREGGRGELEGFRHRVFFRLFRGERGKLVVDATPVCAFDGETVVSAVGGAVGEILGGGAEAGLVGELRAIISLVFQLRGEESRSGTTYDECFGD